MSGGVPIRLSVSGVFESQPTRDSSIPRADALSPEWRQEFPPRAFTRTLCRQFEPEPGPIQSRRNAARLGTETSEGTLPARSALSNASSVGALSAANGAALSLTLSTPATSVSFSSLTSIDSCDIHRSLSSVVPIELLEPTQNAHANNSAAQDAQVNNT